MDRPKRVPRRKLDFAETPEPTSRKERSRQYKATFKAKLMTDQAAYEAFKLLDAQRARERRQRKKQTLTEEELSRQRELNRARQKAFRERRSQATPSSVDPPKKPKTRSELKKVEERKEKNRLSQKKRRENMSSQKKRREKEKMRTYYWQKKGLQTSTDAPETREQQAQQCSESDDPSQPTTAAGQKTPGAIRTANYRIKKVFGTGLIDKLKGFVKSVSKKHSTELKNVGVRYDSPSKKGKQKVSLISDPNEIEKLRSKCILNAKRLINKQPENKNLYKKKKSWRVEYAEQYFEQKSLHLPCKRTITRDLKQKKVLNKSMMNLYKEFIQEHGSLISRATFFRRRPRHVLSFTKTPFRQCLCEVCLNPMLKTKVLNKKLTESERVESLKDLVRLTVCNDCDLSCLARECRKCGVWKLDSWREKVNVEEPVEWTRWECVVGEKGSRIDLRKKRGNVGDMVEELKTETVKLPMHDFVQGWQLKQYSKLCAAVPEGWAIATLDFAENYLCEKQDQPQSSYYGYSQVTVHPCVLYYNCGCGKRKTDNVTVITDELDHSSSLVERITKSLMLHLSKKLPSLKKVVIFSDGCSSQYKSKHPFGHLINLGKSCRLELERCYFGARHGKNPCDALGGLLKQAATRAVKARQVTIQCAEDLHAFACSNLSVEREEKCMHMSRVFWLFKANDRAAEDGICNVSKAIYGTRQLHSLLPTADGLTVRNLSCFCQNCVAGNFGSCENEQWVSEWKGVKEWEKVCKNKLRLQKYIVNERQSLLNDAFLEGDDGLVGIVDDGLVDQVDDGLVGIVDDGLVDQVDDGLVDQVDFDGTVGQVDDIGVNAECHFDAGLSRKDFFRDVLHSMSMSKTFGELERVVFSVLPHLDSYPLPEYVWPTVFDSKRSVDRMSLSLIPKGLEHLFPVCVDSDGNCMPRSISLALFCTEEHHVEIRTRICIESVVRKVRYLSLSSTDLEMLCTFSEFQGENNCEIYEKEILSICKLGTYMGLWQLMAAATALNVTIASVYPQKGQSCGQFLHRTVSPLPNVNLSSAAKRSIVILWTSTRNDMVDEYWVPNHIEPLIPLAEPCEISIE